MNIESEYQLVVDNAMSSQEDMPISNGKPEHAAYLIKKILENAKHSVRVFSGTLTRNFRGVPAYGSDQILTATRDFLDRGGQMKVLLEGAIDVDEDQTWINHPLVRAAHSIPKGNYLLEVRKAPKNLVDELRDAKVLYHWITMDRQAYRLEIDTIQAKAIANFGNPKTAQALVGIFDYLFAKATPLPLPEPQHV